MNEKIYKASKLYAGTLVAGLAGICIWLLYLVITVSGPNVEKVQVFFLFMFIIIFLLFLYAVLALWKVKHDLVLKESGILYEPLKKQIGVNFIPWVEIEEATSQRVAKKWYIVVKLRDSSFSESLNMATGQEWLLGNAFLKSNKSVSGGLDDMFVVNQHRIWCS